MDGQLISVGADKSLSCSTAPSGKLSPPSCQDNQALTSENATLKCVNKGAGTTDATLRARIDKIQTDTKDLSDKINAVSSSSGTKSTYIGNTTMKVNGAMQVTAGGTDPKGILAAKALCAKQYPGAHMCTVMEIYDSVAGGYNTTTMQGIKPNVAIPATSAAWVYMIGWNNPGSSALTGLDEGAAGINENCGGYTYPTADRKWQGLAFTYEALTTGGYSPKFTSNGCSAFNYIACCK